MTDNLTFGGHPVELRRVDGFYGPDVLVRCKNVTGSFSQAKAFVENTNPISGIYPWGIKTTEPAYISSDPNGNVQIACLTDTREKFNELYREAKSLL